MNYTKLPTLLALCFGCTPSSPSPQMGPPHGQAPTSPPATAQPQPTKPVHSPAITLPGTPHDEEHHSVSLSWKVADAKVHLFKLPDPSSPRIGTLRGGAIGSPIAYKTSRVVVTKPRTLTAKHAVNLTTTPYTDPTAPSSTVSLAKGASVDVYKYAGEGTCVLEVNKLLVHANCPDASDFDGTRPRSGPDAFAWWVEVDSGSTRGWIRVDSATIAVHVGESGG